jgi:hypothetical protein
VWVLVDQGGQKNWISHGFEIDLLLFPEIPCLKQMLQWLPLPSNWNSLLLNRARKNNNNKRV